MASVRVDFATTKEKINFICLCHLVVDVGYTVLRDTFDSIHPPSTLHMVLSSPSVLSTLHSLTHKKRDLHPFQWGKLFPADALTVSSADFDIPLLMVLLSNICGLSPPVSTGCWNRFPLDSDNSFEANIVRIKWYRNVVVHSAETSADDPTFNAQWQKISTAILALASRINKYTMYAAYISRLKTEYMDPAAEAPFLKVWNDGWKKDHDNSKKMVEELKGMLIDPFAGGHLEFYCSEETVIFFLYLRQWDMKSSGDCLWRCDSLF